MPYQTARATGVAEAAYAAVFPAVLLRSKLSPPPLPIPMVARQRLGRLLDPVLAHRTCLVLAPPGHGKSCFAALMAAEARARDHHTGWVSFSRDDNEAAAIAYLFEAVGIGPQIERTEQRPQSMGLAAARLSNAIHQIERPVLLVIDDADRVEDPNVAACLKALIDQPPANLTLLLSGRCKPGFAVGPADRSGQILTIGARDLAFTDAEARILVAGHGGSAPAGQVAILNASLGGWPMGVKAAAGLLGEGRTGSPDVIRQFGNFFAEQVAELDASELMAFRRAAVSEAIDRGLVLALTGEAAAFDRVAALAHAGRFVAADPAAPGWYRFHPALRSWLLDGLAVDDRRDCNRRAAAWHLEHGDHERAVEHALAGDDHVMAATLIADLAGSMVELSDVRRLTDWLDRLPAATVADRPELRQARAWINVLTLQADGGGVEDCDEVAALAILRQGFVEDGLAEAMDAAEQWLERRNRADCDEFSERMLCALVAHGAVRRGQFALVQEVTRPLLIRARRSGPDLAYALAIAAKGAAFRAQGQLAEAERVLRAAMDELAGLPLASAIVGAALSRCRYERGAFGDAAALAETVLPGLAQSGFQRAYCQALTVAIRCAALAGRTGEAAALVDQAEIDAYERDWLPLKALSVVERARLGLPQNIDLDQVVPAADEAALAERPLSPAARAFALLSEVRAFEAVRNGDRPRLTAVADHLLQLAAAADDMELRTRATLFNILPQLSGRCDKMVDIETVRFLNHAASSGFQRTIVDVLDVTGVRAVQNFSSEAYTSGSFLALLTLADTSRFDRQLEGQATTAPGEGFSFLTEREIGILSALKTGESNKEIARALKLTPETVKWHLKNIMHKLRARNRDEAVQNAQALGLTLVGEDKVRPRNLHPVLGTPG